MLKKTFTPALLLLTLLTGACSSLNSAQDRELKNWRAQNLEVKDKDPTTAAVLNVLPGFGDFYNGNVGYGVVNLLAWPFSILWAPVGGATGADEVNYFSSKAYVEELELKKKRLKNEVEVAFIGEQISKKDFMIANKKIDALHLTDFQKKIELRDILPLSVVPYDNERVPSSSK